MKATGAALLGFVAGIALTSIVVVLMSGSDEATVVRRDASTPEQPSASRLTVGAGRHDEGVAAPQPIVVPTPGTPDAGRLDARLGILLYGTVSDPAGEPVKARTKWLIVTPDQGPPINVAITDAGTYAATGLLAGRVTLSSSIPGYRPWLDTLDLRADQLAVRKDIVLQPATILVIKAFTPDGRPLLDALKATLPEMAAWSLRVSALASTDPVTQIVP